MSERHGSEHDPEISDNGLVCKAYAEFLKASLQIDKTFDYLKSTNRVSTQMILGIDEIRKKAKEVESIFKKEYAPRQKQNGIAKVFQTPENVGSSVENSLLDDTTSKNNKKRDYPFDRRGFLLKKDKRNGYTSKNQDECRNEDKNQCPSEDPDKCPKKF